MRWKIAPALAISFATGAIGHACSLASFTCQDDAQCQDGMTPGFCEAGGGCSFPDDTCDSGRRFGEHAPSGQADECVPSDGGGESSTTTSATTSASTSTEATTATSVDGSASDGTTSMGASASATDGTSDATDTGGEVGSSDGGDSTGGDTAFFDPFDRPDGFEIGNGWIEKRPDAWRLLDEQVELDFDNGHDFRNNLFYRPLAESLLDVEASVVVNFTTDSPWGYPQVHVRVQAGDVDTQGSLTSYVAFVDAANPADVILTVGRIDGPGFGPQQYASIDPEPIDINTYRLRLRATGTDPVTVEGFFELDTVNGWEIQATATLVDDEVARITTEGTVGASGHLELQWFVLDDFAYVDLGG